MHAIKQLIEDERGAELAEYGLLLALVALAVFASVHTFGKSVSALYPKTVIGNGSGHALRF